MSGPKGRKKGRYKKREYLFKMREEMQDGRPPFRLFKAPNGFVALPVLPQIFTRQMIPSISKRRNFMEQRSRIIYEPKSHHY